MAAAEGAFNVFRLDHVDLRPSQFSHWLQVRTISPPILSYPILSFPTFPCSNQLISESFSEKHGEKIS